ncbi:MAG: hypothetical protein ACRC5H_07245, partial [Treponemataceae bacterium]
MDFIKKAKPLSNNRMTEHALDEYGEWVFHTSKINLPIEEAREEFVYIRQPLFETEQKIAEILPVGNQIEIEDPKPLVVKEEIPEVEEQESQIIFEPEEEILYELKSEDIKPQEETQSTVQPILDCLDEITPLEDFDNGEQKDDYTKIIQEEYVFDFPCDIVDEPIILYRGVVDELPKNKKNISLESPRKPLHDIDLTDLLDNDPLKYEKNNLCDDSPITAHLFDDVAPSDFKKSFTDNCIEDLTEDHIPYFDNEKNNLDCSDDCNEKNNLDCSDDCDEKNNLDCSDDCNEKNNLDCSDDCDEKNNLDCSDDCNEKNNLIIKDLLDDCTAHADLEYMISDDDFVLIKDLLDDDVANADFEKLKAVSEVLSIDQIKMLNFEHTDNLSDGDQAVIAQSTKDDHIISTNTEKTIQNLFAQEVELAGQVMEDNML